MSRRDVKVGRDRGGGCSHSLVPPADPADVVAVKKLGAAITLQPASTIAKDGDRVRDTALKPGSCRLAATITREKAKLHTHEPTYP